nr:MAG TPA: putative endoribonuclease [Caudoviricetes sp.]
MNMKSQQFKVPDGMSELVQVIADRQGINKNALLKEIIWQWKKKLNRSVLLDMFDLEKLTELEIKIYSEVKG